MDSGLRTEKTKFFSNAFLVVIVLHEIKKLFLRILLVSSGMRIGRTQTIRIIGI